mgnify:CR=1 FL=1
MIAPIVTPHLRRAARRGGYLAAISATIPPRMLYRRLGAALQAAMRCAGATLARHGECPWLAIQIRPFSASRPCIDASFQLASFGPQP